VRRSRPAATAVAALALLLPTRALAANSGNTTAQLTPTAPARLTSPARLTTPKRLPDTGFDLLPEAAIGATLLGAGVALRRRRFHA